MRKKCKWKNLFYDNPITATPPSCLLATWIPGCNKETVTTKLQPDAYFKQNCLFCNKEIEWIV